MPRRRPCLCCPGPGTDPLCCSEAVACPALCAGGLPEPTPWRGPGQRHPPVGVHCPPLLRPKDPVALLVACPTWAHAELWSSPAVALTCAATWAFSLLLHLHSPSSPSRQVALALPCPGKVTSLACHFISEVVGASAPLPGLVTPAPGMRSSLSTGEHEIPANKNLLEKLRRSSSFLPFRFYSLSKLLRVCGTLYLCDCSDALGVCLGPEDAKFKQSGSVGLLLPSWFRDSWFVDHV